MSGENSIFNASTLTGPEQRHAASEQPTATMLTIAAHPVISRVGCLCVIQSSPASKTPTRTTIALSRNEPLFTRPNQLFGQALNDPYVSRRPVNIQLLGDGSVKISALGTNTAVQVQGVPLANSCILSETEVQEGVTIELAERVVLLLHWGVPPYIGESADLGMVGDSGEICRVRKEIHRIADLDVPVLIRGETGTGKELVASAIHRTGGRKAQRFVSVNLGALPVSLAAAELFGSVKGAYTGSQRDQAGYFKTAHKGVLFLDEIGEALPEIQALLLRVLETGEILPVGRQLPFKVDVRLLAATDANLEERVTGGKFKSPLLHRLAGYEIWVPPLRRRRDDIGRLFVHFAAEEAAKIGESARLQNRDPKAPPLIPADRFARLLRYDWPGNIRQLRNVVRQLVIDSQGQKSLLFGPKVQHLLNEGPTGRAASPPEPGNENPKRRPIEIEEAELYQAMENHRWEPQKAARALEISRASIYKLISAGKRIRLAKDLNRAEISACLEQCHGDVNAAAGRLKVSRQGLLRRMKALSMEH